MVVECSPAMWSAEQANSTRHVDVYKRILSYGYKMECIVESPHSKTHLKLTPENADKFTEAMGDGKCVDWKVSMV